MTDKSMKSVKTFSKTCYKRPQIWPLRENFYLTDLSVILTLNYCSQFL